MVRPLNDRPGEFNTDPVADVVRSERGDGGFEWFCCWLIDCRYFRTCALIFGSKSRCKRQTNNVIRNVCPLYHLDYR